MKRMAARKAATETLHWSSQMRRRYRLTQPSWVSQKQSRSKAQTTATHRPPSGQGWQTHSFKLVSGDENVFYIKAQTEGVPKTSQMFLRGLMRHFEMKILEPYRMQFVLSPREQLFQTLSTVIFVFFPNTKKINTMYDTNLRITCCIGII